MKDRITNRLDMAGTVINVTQSHGPAWNNQQPLDFGTDFAAFMTEYANITAAAAAAYAATTGPADAKDLAETALEALSFTLARACCNHLKKTGDLTRRAQVDFSESDIVRLRGQALVTTATLIRDIASALTGETNAMNRGVTTARVATLTAAITAFATLLNAPRGAIVNRSTKIRDVETDVAGLMTRLPDLDDLVIQFDATEAGRAFIAAWNQARIIVDAGHGPGEEEEGGSSSSSSSSSEEGGSSSSSSGTP